MENPETIITNNSATTPKPRGKGGNAKIILCSIAGALVFLGAFFFTEKQTGLIGLFKHGDDSETAQDLADSEVEEEDFWVDIEESESSEEEGEKSKLRNTNDLAFSGLSYDQYDLAVAFLEEELTEREPESDYFIFDNTSIAYEVAYFDSTNVTDGLENIDFLPEEGFTDMSSDSANSNSQRGYSTIAFNIISSSRKKYQVVIDTGGTISGFKEIRISEQ